MIYCDLKLTVLDGFVSVADITLVCVISSISTLKSVFSLHTQLVPCCKPNVYTAPVPSIYVSDLEP